MEFREYLVSKGFEPFRKVFIKNKLTILTSKECFMTDDTFSSMIEGGLCIFYIKDDLEIVYGLGEVGKPPMLLSPVPKSHNTFTHLSEQDITERAMKKYNNDDIYRSMFEGILLHI